MSPIARKPRHEGTTRGDVPSRVGGRKRKTEPTWPNECTEASDAEIPRISRLMALAIRLEELVRNGTIRDYAEVARRGRVTRARMTQIIRKTAVDAQRWRQVRDLYGFPTASQFTKWVTTAFSANPCG